MNEFINHLAEIAFNGGCAALFFLFLDLTIFNLIRWLKKRFKKPVKKIELKTHFIEWQHKCDWWHNGVFSERYTHKEAEKRCYELNKRNPTFDNQPILIKDVSYNSISNEVKIL